MAPVYVYFSNGSYQKTNLEEGSKTPFFVVGICNGSKYDREKAYHFLSKDTYESWRNTSYANDTPFCQLPGIFTVQDHPPALVDYSSSESTDDEMPELESVP